MHCVDGRPSAQGALRERSIGLPFILPPPLRQINCIVFTPILLARFGVQFTAASILSSSLMSTQRSSGSISWLGKVRCTQSLKSGRLWLSCNWDRLCKNFSPIMAESTLAMISRHTSDQTAFFIAPALPICLNRMARQNAVSVQLWSALFQCFALQTFWTGSGKMLLRQQFIWSIGAHALVSSG